MSYDSRSISSQQHHYQKSYDKVEAHVFDREGEKARTVYLEDLVDHLQDPAKPIGIRTRYVSVEMTLNPLEQQIEVTSVPSHPHLSNVGHIDFDPEQDELRVVMSCQYDDDLASHRDMNIQLTQNLAVTDQTDFQQALRYLVVGHCAVAKSEALRLREDPDRRVAKVKAKPEVNGFRPRGFSQQKNH